jgi:hypothetical protein
MSAFAPPLARARGSSCDSAPAKERNLIRQSEIQKREREEEQMKRDLKNGFREINATP